MKRFGMRLILQSLTGFTLSLGVFLAWADQVIEKPVSADTPDKFVLVVDQIKTERRPGGRYEFIHPDEMAKVETDFVAMKDLLVKAGSVQAMSPSDKLHLFNLQENANGVLTHSDSNRLICERTTSVGTSIPKTSCKTLGEIERNRLGTKRQMDYEAEFGSVCRNPKICRGD
jgi:hypothetical protein